jgi:uncharacterized repeat protein (TIGR01451 family)
MKKLIFLYLVFAASLVMSADTKIPNPDFSNFDSFYVFGPEGQKKFGRDDSTQIIYLSVPESVKSFKLTLNDPGSVTAYERRSIDGQATKTVYKMYGGEGASGFDSGGDLLKEASYTKEASSVELGRFDSSAGELDGDFRLFKLHVKAVSGENVNFFSISLDTSEIDVFAYDLSIHARGFKGSTIGVDVDVKDGTTQIEEMNYDMGDSMSLFFNEKKLKVSEDGQRVINLIKPAQFGRSKYKLVSEKAEFNNVSFSFRAQDGSYLKNYLTSEPLPVKKVAEKILPAPNFNFCEIETSLVLFEKKVPMKAAVGDDLIYEMIVTAKQSTKDIVISGLVPSGCKIVSSKPQGKLEGKNISWTLPQMEKGESKKIIFTVKPTSEGVLGFCSVITATPKICKTTIVGKAELVINKTGPAVALLGSKVLYKITVKNIGSSIAKNVMVVDKLPAGLTHELNQKSVTLKVGDLKPGESKVLSLTTKAVKRGKQCNVAVASAVNAKTVRDEVCTLIVEPGLKILKTGNKVQFVGKRASYKIIVSNTGDTVLTNLVAVDKLPAGVKVIDSGGGYFEKGQIDWKIASLKPKESKTYKVVLTSRVTGNLCNTAFVKDSSGLNASSKACTLWKGHPALLLEVVDSVDPLLPGEETIYTIRITNQGTAADGNVRFSALFPAGISPMSIVGSTKGSVKGKSVTVASQAILAPKEVVEWKIRAKAIKAGDARLKVKMFSDLLKTPVVEEESTHVY